MSEIKYKSFFRENKFWMIVNNDKHPRHKEMILSGNGIREAKKKSIQCIKENVNINTLLIFRAIGKLTAVEEE